MKVGAVVVTWRDTEMTESALRSLLDGRPAFDTVVCIAQELTDAQTSHLQVTFGSRVAIDRVDTNLGYCTAANRGIDRLVAGGCDWVMTLNNDATIDPACVERCLSAAARERRVAIVGPAIAFTDRPERLWYGGGRLYSAVGLTRHVGLGAPTARTPATSLTDYVPGCCCLIAADAWRSIGRYRDDYFMYYEDVEWCDRARRAGWECLYVGEVLCRHAGSATAGAKGELTLTPTSAYYLGRNSMRFAMETSNRALRTARVAGVATLSAAHNARRLKGAPPRSARAYAEGVRDAFRGCMGPRSATTRADRGATSAAGT